VSDAQTAPAVARNRDPILAVLRRVLPARGTVLEIASGTGEHAVHFAAALPDIDWQPSDPDAAALRSIVAWREAARLPNVLAPLLLDVTSPVWPVQQTDAMVCINMIHISPWRAAEALMAGAGRVLESGGMLFLYGPYKEGGVHTASSNEAFDASLRARNPEWGVRELDDVKALAARHGIEFVERVAMPANNLSVVFRRR
jgi:hypothetical protein